MPYAVVDDVKDAITANRLATFVPYAAGDIDAIIQQTINAQSGEMDVYIGKLYNLPLDISGLTSEQQDNITDLLKRWIVALVLYALIPQGSSGVPLGIQISYDRVRSRLNDLIVGKYRLPYLTGRISPAFAVVGDVENELTTQLFRTSRIF